MFTPFSCIFNASFDLGNNSYSLKKFYSKGETIEGWVNISIMGEDIDEPVSIEDRGFEGEIELSEWLDLNSINYACSPHNCVEDYESTKPEQVKNISLQYGEEKLVGTIVEGNPIDEILDFRFNILVENEPSCKNPLKIDFLSNGENVWESNKFSSNYDCRIEGGKGCFDFRKVSEFEAGGNRYCEKIELPPSGEFKLGAWIRKDNSSSSEQPIEMELYNLNGNLIQGNNTCQLNESQISSLGKEVNCTINNRKETSQQNFVCINIPDSASGYWLRKEEDNNSCGFYEDTPPLNPSQFKYDYHIFARGARYGEIGEFEFNDTTYPSQMEGRLKENIESYLGRYVYDCE